MAVFVALLLAVTMIPVAGMQSALADEPVARPATESGDVALEGAIDGGAAATENDATSDVVAATVREDGSLVADGLVYNIVDGSAVLVGFEDGNALEGNVAVPERLSDGTSEYAVTGVAVAEGQSAPGVRALELPQTVESINTKGLAAALPGLASINVDGTAGAYSSANGLLFKQADEAASSDGSTVRVANRELLWTPPATVIARIPGTCKRVAAGAFTDAKALETIMAFSTVESIARPERDAEGNTVKEGAFTDEQVSRVNIVIPISATVQSEGTDRISADVFLSEQVGLDVKQTPWCDYGFDIKRFTVGIPCGSTSVTVAVPEGGKVETPVITVGDYVGYPQWNPKPGEVDWPANGLVFEYKADMTVSVRWDGGKEAIPSHLELPAYVVENGVKTAVTEVAPNAFEGASQLESVVVPEGVTTIGESAFAGCSGLRSVFLPSTLKTIDYAAFKGAGLESVDVPSAVRVIGGEAFAECASLEDARYDGVGTVSESAFANSPVAGSVVQMVNEVQNAGSPEGRTSVASEDISAYAAPPGPSELNSTYYINFPIDTNNIGAGKERFLTSTFYDAYYEKYQCDSSAHGSSTCGSAIKGPEELCIEENLVSSSTILYHSYGDGGKWIVQNRDYPKYVYWNGKRCLQYAEHWMGAENKASVEHVIYVPKDDVYLLHTTRYYNGSAPADGVGVNASTHPWNGGFFNYATFTSVSHRLTVNADVASDIAIDGTVGSAWNSAGGVISAESTHSISCVKKGYSIGEVTTNGAGTSYDAPTNTLTMGHEDSTVSAELIPNDINVQVVIGKHGASAALGSGAYNDAEGTAGNVVFGEQQTDDALGAYYDMTIKTDATKDNPGFDSGDGLAMTNRSTVSVVSTGSGKDKRTTVQFKTSEADGRKVGCEITTVSKNGWMQDYWKLVNVDTGAEVVLGAAGTNIDYAHKWRLVHEYAGIDYGITYDRNNCSVWTGPDTNLASYNTATGFNNLPVPTRNGFWFAGWKWANEGDMGGEADSGNDAAAWWNGTDDADARQFGIPAGAYGNAELIAVWTPKVYQVNYDVSATATTAEGGATENMASEPDTSYFVHPQARSVIAEGGGNSWTVINPADSGTSDEAKARLVEVDLTYLDKGGATQNIASEQLDYTLAESKLEGFAYEGWTTGKISAGTTPSDSGKPGPWKHVFNDGTADLSNESTIFGSYWTTAQTMPEGGYDDDNTATLYGVWSRVGEVAVTLGAEQPHEARGADEGGTVDDGESVTGGKVGTAQAVQYWQQRGLFVYGELLPAANPDHTTTTELDREALQAVADGGKDVKLTDADLQFADLKRTGFRFLGWGKRASDGSPASVYVRYLENPDGGSEAGFYLTPEGAEHVLAWEENPPKNGENELAETWDALWEIRTYDITLRLPASAVNGVKIVDSGSSEYGWKRNTDGKDSSWRTAEKQWKYWDVFSVPEYKLNNPFNTYEGWYLGEMQSDGTVKWNDTASDGSAKKPVITEAQGQLGRTDPTSEGVFRVTAENLGYANLGYADGQETDLDNVSAPDGSVVLWMKNTPVYINVTAPIGVFLAADDPYVVGSDPRTNLETMAHFTVKESSHDLVLTGVTAADIVDADVDQKTNEVANVSVVGDKKADGSTTQKADGLAAKMLEPYTWTDDKDTSVNGKNSRMFWISPVKTVDDYNGKQDPGTTKTGERVYFGYGEAAGDNVLTDNPDKSGDDVLAGFGLKKDLSQNFDTTSGRATSLAGSSRDVKVTVNEPMYDESGKPKLDEYGNQMTHDAEKTVTWRDYEFYYGLDLNKCKFDLGKIQEMVEEDPNWAYNAGYKKPLVRLMFTFAVERVPDVSYYSMRLGDGSDEAQAAESERAGVSGREELPEISVGA